jgi:hypothetical protein
MSKPKPKRPDDVSYMRGWFQLDYENGKRTRFANDDAKRYVKAFNEHARALL